MIISGSEIRLAGSNRVKPVIRLGQAKSKQSESDKVRL